MSIRPSELGDCGTDCIIFSWPWFVDLEVEHVLEGPSPGEMVRVLSIQHTYFTSGEYSWMLRKNTAGGFNVLSRSDGPPPTLCPFGTSPEAPYIKPRDGMSLDDIRDAGILSWGHHKR